MQFDRITMESGKRSGQPCIRGLRITVYDMLAQFAAGATEQDVLHDFPELQHKDILACFAYAAERERCLQPTDTTHPAILAECAYMEEAWRAKEEQPGQVATLEVDGRIIPISAVACPDHQYFQEDGQTPVCCGNEDDGTCCGELFGVRQGHVLCSAKRPPKAKPTVALVALQKRVRG